MYSLLVVISFFYGPGFIQLELYSVNFDSSLALDFSFLFWVIVLRVVCIIKSACLFAKNSGLPDICVFLANIGPLG